MVLKRSEIHQTFKEIAEKSIENHRITVSWEGMDEESIEKARFFFLTMVTVYKS
jgi:hypothetical protein